MMGSGKSAVGRNLAQKLEARFTDLDHYIQDQENRSVSEIFELYGEQEFRRMERIFLDRLLGSEPHIIALGGGTISSKKRTDEIRKYSTLCFIDAPLTLILERVQRNTNRPLLTDGQGQLKPEAEIMRILEQLSAKRAPFYRQADIHIQPKKGYTVDKTTKILISNLYDHARQANDQAPE